MKAIIGPERLRNQHGLKLHPTQKPEALLHRVMLASTGHDDIVLDPFAGTGTTAVVARRLGRHFIAIERHPAYVEAAWGRLRRTRHGSADGIAMTPTKRDAPRIPFGNLVERGLLSPGEVLCDSAQRFTARVRADGSLISSEHRGSIHSVAALVQGAPACNGWVFWFARRNGNLVPIDHFRQQLRAELT